MGIFSSSWERQVNNCLFDFVDVDQFRNYKFTTLCNYAWMCFLVLLHTALYGVDVYTCIKLLAFNTWGSTVKPWLSFKVSKWLFAACIICSIVLLAFEIIRGLRVYKTRNISLIYTNPFARCIKSFRGYGYFCVLNEVSPTGGFDKMAFYTFFTFQGSLQLILADSPRQVINALTLYSVFNQNGQFFENIKEISLKNRNEALILYGMTISIFIWIFFIANLFFAIIFAFPVYYRILNKLHFQSLRQYVCVKVDHTVKRLAREHKLVSLKKYTRTKDYQSLEKPTIPSIDFPITPSETYKAQYSFKSSTYESLINNEKDKDPFSDSNEVKTTLQKAVQRQRPLELHHHQSSSTLLLNRQDEYQPIKRSNSDTSSELSDSLDTNTIQSSSSQYNYQQYPAYQQRSTSNFISSLPQRKPPPRIDSRPSFDQDLEKGVQLSTSQSSLSPSFYDHYQNDDGISDYYGHDLADSFALKSSTQTEPTSEMDELESSLIKDLETQKKPKSSSNLRKEVRPSLIRRAQDMESEDYSRYKPGSRSGTFDESSNKP